MTHTSPSEADTILALELDEKVKKRVTDIVQQTLTHYDVHNQIYTSIVSRLMHDRQFVMALMNQMNQLQRDTQFNGMYPQPWRY